MINRELIRNKIVQLTYAYYQNGNQNIDTAEKELFFSLSKAYDLYIIMLSLIVAITKEAHRQYDIATAKARRENTPEPSPRFIYNRLAMQLEMNEQLADLNSMQKVKWSDYPEILTKVYKQIAESEFYDDYMSDSTDDYATDREIWRKLYRTIIEDNDDIDAMLESESLYWNDDKEIVDSFVVKTIKRFDEKNRESQELMPEFDSNDDREFARKLFRAAILNGNEYQQLMGEASKNWDLSRLAYMDIIIMQIAIAEMLTFPSIPVSVTINEYIELAKRYSTPRSGGYVNGMLDAIARYLIDNGRMMKQMPNNKN
ncbi:MAG: transcription antitermination factor NusB [Prevotella sp.]|nr:transcription antitermination factor NusB [Prevotella sp.]